MAPLPNEASSAENSKAAAANLVPNCALLLSSSAKFVPFLRPPSNKKLNNLASPNVVAIGELLQTSISSVADNFLKFLHSFASENPLLQKVLSLHSEFNSFCHQVRFRNSRNVNSISNHNFALVLGDSVAGVVVANGVLNFLNIYNTLLVVRLVLTWFPNSPPAIVSPLSTICDPYLNIFRGLIPPLGGTLDLSPILAFLVLNVFTSTASALPAELPVTEQTNQQISPSPPRSSHPTTSQQKWARRLQGNRTKSSGDGN
ncbi:hypothetical protein UlMin_035753 [Ulmus minor]